MAKPKIFFAFFLFFSVFFPAASGPARADDPMTKLGRGVTNLATGPGEYIVQFEAGTEEGNIFANLVYGIVRGTMYAAAREVTGAYDVVTFPIPLPAHYAPIMEPATVFDSMKEVNGAKARG